MNQGPNLFAGDELDSEKKRRIYINLMTKSAPL